MSRQRILTRTLGTLAVALLVATPAAAQVVQSVQVGFGAFLPRGIESRDEGDVLIANLFRPALPPPNSDITDSLAFEVNDFRGPTLFGEWLVAFGDHVEVGAGLGYYSRTVPSVYVDLVEQDFTEIEQDLSLRVVPVTGVVRFMPIGRIGTFQPYVGAGVGLLQWRYSEIGDFVDPLDPFLPVFEGRFVDSGSTVAPVWVAGARIPLAGDIYGLTVEYRRQYGSGELDPEVFLNDKIDLGGGNFNVGFLIRF